MKLNDMDFFHQATKKICGSLDIEIVLTRCLAFFQEFMPLDGIAMNIYRPNARAMVNIAAKGKMGFSMVGKTVFLSDEAARHLDEDEINSVEIINHPEKHIVARYHWQQVMGKKPMSAMGLKIEIEDQVLGVIFFLAKGFDRYSLEHARLLRLVHDPFAIALANTLEHKKVLRLKDLLADDNQYLTRQLHHIAGDEIVGSKFGLKFVMDLVHQIAPQKSHVLLLGETGVGKEVVANAIHYSSPRAEKPFVKVNCGAIPENLIDSELFGHEKGAFTGALTQKRGRFERADKGTLFLDEVGDLPPQAQVRLLRVLSNKEIERVGGTRPIHVDIRIIAATHHNLIELVKQEKFREDLWFRLNVFPIVIPPLRQRKSDIPALTHYFLEKKIQELNFDKLPALAPGTIEKLQNYHWPGNVRELENLVERTIILGMTGSPGKPLDFGPLLPQLTDNQPQSAPADSAKPIQLNDVTRNHIAEVLKMTGGRVQGEKGAAALLGIHPSTLRNKMKKLNIPYGRNAEPLGS